MLFPRPSFVIPALPHLSFPRRRESLIKKYRDPRFREDDKLERVHNVLHYGLVVLDNVAICFIMKTGATGVLVCLRFGFFLNKQAIPRFFRGVAGNYRGAKEAKIERLGFCEISLDVSKKYFDTYQ